jgi:hypothetical protein
VSARISTPCLALSNIKSSVPSPAVFLKICVAARACALIAGSAGRFRNAAFITSATTKSDHHTACLLWFGDSGCATCSHTHSAVLAYGSVSLWTSPDSLPSEWHPPALPPLLFVAVSGSRQPELANSAI